MADRIVLANSFCYAASLKGILRRWFSLQITGSCESLPLLRTTAMKRQLGHGSMARGASPWFDPRGVVRYVGMRFFLRRLRLGLRNAKSTDTVAVLKELIAETEERLDRPERRNGQIAD